MDRRFVLLPAMLLHLFNTNTATAAETALKCDRVVSTVLKNGVLQKNSGAMNANIYYAFNEMGMVQTFSAKRNDPSDLFVKKGMNGHTYLYGGRIIEASLVTQDATNQWYVDLVARTVRWSTIGRKGTGLDGFVSTFDLKCQDVK